MQLYVLAFESPGALEHAFARVMECPGTEVCAADAETCSLRFRAPTRRADRVVERIYLDGGLRWCSRHAELLREEA